MANYRLTKKAVADLTDIWNYSFDTWSEKQADIYYTTLLNTCKDLAKNPELGKKYDNVHPTLLGYKAYQHIIFYTVEKGEILIIRILHHRMDLKSRING